MYTLAIQRNFIAQHFLVGGDWGAEGQWHSHQYKLEALLEGEDLNEHGFLIDIEEVKNHLDAIVGRFRDKTLNELDEFEGLNPSVENFSRIVCEALDERLDAPNVSAISVKLWVSEHAWAAYDLER